MNKTALISACERVGGQANMARILGIKPPSVNQWIKDERQVPEDRCPAIEFATDGSVTCEELRPDVTWFRVKDRAWPHPNGRPLVDHAKSAEKRAA